jgi:hypothetical protein
MKTISKRKLAKPARRKITQKQGFLFRKKDLEQKDLVPYKKLLISVFVLGLGTIGLVLLLQRSLPPEVPLFYGLPKTEEQLASSLNLIIPSLAALTIIIINLLISQFIKDTYLKSVLVLVGVAGVFFATITTLKIIFLVGSF